MIEIITKKKRRKGMFIVEVTFPNSLHALKRFLTLVVKSDQWAAWIFWKGNPNITKSPEE